jgi:hypothetical protein
MYVLSVLREVVVGEKKDEWEERRGKERKGEERSGEEFRKEGQRVREKNLRIREGG